MAALPLPDLLILVGILGSNIIGEITTFVYDSHGNQTEVINPLGNITTSVFDSEGREIATVNPLGERTTTVYNSAGQVAETIDALDRITTFVYDSSNREIAVVDPLGNRTTTVYGSGDQVLATIDPLGNRTSFVYDADGRQIATENALNHFTTTVYDAAGQVINTIDPLGRTTTYGYDAAGEQVTVTDPLGHTTTTTFDADGRVTEVTDARSHSTQTTYDAAGEVTVITDVLSNRTTFTYDADGQQISVTNGLGNTTTAVYDAAGQVTESIDALSRVTTFVYDSAGQQTVMIDYTSASTTTGYDAAGEVTSITKPSTNVATFTYDAAGQLISQTDFAGNKTTFVYDAAGEKIATVDPLSHRTTAVFDADGRQIATVDALSNRTTTVFDADGRVVNVIDSLSNKTTFVYDALGEETEEINPLGHTATFAYDAAGELTSSTDMDSRVITYTYDADGRETGETWLNADATTANVLTFTYDTTGNLLTAANNAGTYTMVYDADNQMVHVAEPVGTSLTMVYDAIGNRTEVDDSFGGVEISRYDINNNLVNRAFYQGSDAILSDEIIQIGQEFNTLDQVTNLLRSAGEGPAVVVATTNYTYDDDGQITNLQHENSSGGNIANYTYTYDAAGNLTTETRNSTTTTYTYDATNQLTGDGTSSETYDAEGNRTNTGYTVGTGNELTSDGTYNYTYDGAGNEITKTDISTGDYWTYGYDNKNEMTSAVDRTSGGTIELSATYTYDAFGNRIEASVTQSGTTTVTKFAMDGWDPALVHTIGNSKWNVWADLDGSGSLTTRYLRGDVVDQLFARIDKSGSTLTPCWTLTDQQGSIRDVIDNSATVMDSITYDAFGNITVETDSSYRGRYAWTGRELDVETGLQYNRARYYDAGTGRWISQDSLGFDAGDSNLYRYVRNQPTDATDPSGNAPFGVVPNYASVKQGGDDCAFAAVGVSFAQQRPSDIASMIDKNITTPTFNVWVPIANKPIKIDIAKENALLTNSEQYSSSNSNWLALLEIAVGRALMPISHASRPYDAIQGPAMTSTWIYDLTRHGSTSNTTFRRTEDDLFNIIKGAWDQKKIVTALSLFPGRNRTGIESFHWYAVTGYGTSRICGKYIKLFNPWGSNTAQFGDRGTAIRGHGEPEFTMYMSDFKKAFSMITYEN